MQRLPLAGTVDLRGLDELRRNVLQTGDVDDHHVAHELPVDEHDQTGQPQSPVIDDRLPPALKNRIEHHLPGEAQDDAANEVRHEEDGTEEVSAAQLAGQNVGQGEGPQVHRDDRDDRHERSEPQCRDEMTPLTECPDVVVSAHEPNIGEGAELGEGEIEPHEEGDDERDHEGQQGWPCKYWEELFQCLGHIYLEVRPAPAGPAGYQRAPTGTAARELNGSNVPPREERGWGDESPSCRRRQAQTGPNRL